MTATPPHALLADAGALTPQQLRQWIHDGQELAILDVREEGVFARGHLLLAGNAPLWRLDAVLPRLVPRLGTRVVLVDGDGTLLARAVQRLQRDFGYTQVRWLAGGTAAWQAAGLEVFSGINLLSKAFGEVIEHALDTPRIEATELRERLERGDDLVVVDGRTPEEFRNFSIPGARSLPNGELLYRIAELAPNPDTLVVVNCAGRTRSILGAQTLIDAGIPNPVVALKDGTMAWLQHGLALRHGATDALPEPSAAGLAAARTRAAAVAQRAGVAGIDAAQLAAWRADSARSLYLFDVRTREEYEAGHLPASRWVPGGQLVQATDQYIGTRHARVVLVDWDGVRARTTAAWLAQLGAHEVYLLPAQPQAQLLEAGPEPRPVRLGAQAAPAISPTQLQQLLQQRAGQGVAVYDVDSSLAFAKRHVAGAQFAAPDRLPAFLATLAPGSTAVITSADGTLAQAVAAELLRPDAAAAPAAGLDLRALAGGNAAWFEQGLPTDSGRTAILTGDDDDWYSPYAYTDPQERLAKMREYLDWEVALAAGLARDGGARIRLAGRA
ncbi:MAG TPA: rhodanese-like domain-containing protein [Pseudorhodoferax sp.]|nr:rhodanese-like domain-containing protein [Pseudorhodoferax sp.]